MRYPDGHENWRRDERADFKETRYGERRISVPVFRVESSRIWGDDLIRDEVKSQAL